MASELVTVVSKRGQRIPQELLDEIGKTHEFGFNPDEPRDERGRWTDEGGGEKRVATNGKPATVAERDGKEEPQGRISERGYIADSDTSRSNFRSALEGAAKAHKFGAAVEVKSDDFYKDKENKLFLSKDGKAGAAVTKDGDLVSVFKHPESKEDIMPMLKEAASHATTLDAFDTKDGYLPNLYSKLGFKAVAKVPFDPKQAPKGWNHELMDEPNVVLMSKNNGIDISKGYDASKIPSMDYDSAHAKQHALPQITTDTIEQFRGGVKSDELAKHKDNIEGAFNQTLRTKIVPTHSLISNKNELADPKFLRGEKADPRQRATDAMLGSIAGKVAKRDPISVKDNMDGTFTIKDGNATSQAAMLAGWSKLPVHIDEEAPEPEMSDIDKALVDYKPGERPLNDPAKSQRISDVLHNSRFVPYSKTRFFDGVNQMMGATKATGQAYKELRDKFFNSLPVVHVPMDQIVVTQRNVNKDKVAALLKQPPGTGANASSIQAVRYKGETYILNGHHRAIVKALRGDKTIKSNLLDIGDQDLSTDEIKAYSGAAGAKPQLDKLITDVAAAHDATAYPASLKSLGGRGGARAKVNSKPPDGYDGDWTKIKDIARGRILAKDEGGVVAVVDDLKKRLGPDVKPKVTVKPEEGFADIKFNPVMNGVTTEISVMTEQINGLAEQVHPYYKQKQEILRNANNQGRAPTEEELAEITSLNKRMRDVFTSAKK